MTFEEHKKITAEDCRSIAKFIEDVAKACEEGNMDEFVKFWMEGGTEEGDAKINAVCETVIMRFLYRKNLL